ncbi:sodium-dependent transporter [Paremcibacter congregatus]|uniref:sodium-dependent transporter n=1 Tax=Paremcibacter congregatus TaxID=2043170 RepID=UPI0030ED64D8|tara:strand:- start:208 stop:1587 length:1380 start_codon:yes stop_codon:yes gene_type:complete
MQAAKHEHWSSGFTFLLAAVGSAVGLGNIWRFPYVVAENGGGAFVLIYLAIVVVFGIPLLMSELMIGRKSQKPPLDAMRSFKVSKAQRLWDAVGWSYLLVPMGILTFYSVVAGWTLDYAIGMGIGTFNDLKEGESAQIFADLQASPAKLIFWMTLSVGITVGIVARGLKSGLEQTVKILMPALFAILIILVLYASITGDFVRSFSFMFTPDFTKITPELVLMAAGQAFFSLSLGSGAIMVYGSYLTKDISIPKMAVGVAFADTFVALLAGFAIFPIVFAFGVDHAAGPGLVFVTLPIVFNDMGGIGQIFGLLFFLLLAFAAVTSTISLLEPMVAQLSENGKIKRARAAIYAGAAFWFVGIFVALSNNILAEVYPLGFIPLFAGMNIEGLINFLAANVFMVLNGMLVAIFVGWSVKRSVTLEEMGLGDSVIFKIWFALVRFVVPVGVSLIFLDVAFGIFQ